MNIKDEHTSRLWTFILKGEIMDLDDDELIATRVNNKAASWKEVERLRKELNKEKEKKDYYKECLEVVSKELDNIDYDQILFAINDRFISKDKVRDLIKQLDKIQEEEPDAYLVILYLKKLLGERN